MKAVIMAGGEGTRLRPLTSRVPKPMVPVANTPMMTHVISLLREHGFDEIVVTVAFLADQIRDHYGDGSDLGVRLMYSVEDEQPLGTAGSVRNAAHLLDEPFLVISGDVLTDLDLSAVWKAHHEREAAVTIGLTRVEDPVEFGVVICDPEGAVERFLEKPTWGQVFSDTVNTGIFAVDPSVFDWIPEGTATDFSSDVFPALLADGQGVYGHVLEGYWEDIGTLDAYLRVHRDVLDGRVQVDIEGFTLRDGVHLGEGSHVDPDAEVIGPALIGQNCTVSAGARIGPYSVLGANVAVQADADLERVVIADNTHLGPGVRLRGTVVGRSCDLRRHVRTDEGAVLGDEVFVGPDAVIGSDVKVYPFKTIESGAVVNDSIVWESQGTRSLFGADGIRGLANVDITPEFATKIAMAFASTLKRGSTITTSRDSSRVARMLKRAIMSGLNSAGLDVADLEAAPLPVTRFQVRTTRSQGGVTVRLAPDDPSEVIIRLLDADGADLSEAAQRKVERNHAKEDHRRVLGPDIGDIGFPPRAMEHYTAALADSVDVAAVRSADLKVVVDYSHGAASFVMPNVLSKLGVDVLAINPYASTVAMTASATPERAARVGELVRASGADLGAVIRPDGDRLTVVDDRGEVLTDDAAFEALLALRLAAGSSRVVVAPVSAPSSIEAACLAADAAFHASPMSSAGITETTRRVGADLAGDLAGGIVLGQFLPANDGIAALVSFLEALAVTRHRLSETVVGLGVHHVVRREVVTPWEAKGLVMRMVMEQAAGSETVLVDGVKVVRDDGWVLTAPDPSEPVTHVIAESTSASAAAGLADEAVRRIRQTVR